MGWFCLYAEGMEPLGIEGAWVFTPRVFSDDRGDFLESFQGAGFAEAVGHRLDVAQVNTSVSRRGTLRGVHFADVPPGQAKYVTCTSGAVLDVAIDIRTGSPTFGEWACVQLDDQDRRAIYVAEGLGHAFLALTDDATVSYLCSQPYRPGAEHGIDPLDRALRLPWPDDVEVLLSDKDAAAPSLETAAADGLLPTYDDCLALYQTLRESAPAG